MALLQTLVLVSLVFVSLTLLKPLFICFRDRGNDKTPHMTMSKGG